MKVSINSFFRLFFILSILLVHFDPTRLRLTIVVLFVPAFIATYLRFSFKSYLPVALAGLSIVFPFYNFLVFRDFDYSYGEFVKTYVLYVVAALIYICIIYMPLDQRRFDYGKSVITALYLIIFVCSLQFFGYLLLNTTIFYNPFEPFQYNNQAIVETLVANALPRAQGLYLEPSYLGLVIITLTCMSLLYNKNVKLTLILGAAAIFLSGSRGGIFGFFLILLWYFYFNMGAAKMWGKVFYFILFISIIPVFVLFTPILSLLSAESLATENTSQYARFYSGFQLSYYVLKDHYLGLPLGSIEQSFSFFMNELNTSYSFFFFNIFYHGWASFLILLFIAISIIVQKVKLKLKILLVIYVLLYFNMTGSVIAPDTYFWFVCFYYAYKIGSQKSPELSTINP